MDIVQEFLRGVSSGAIVTHLGYVSYILIFCLVLVEGPVVTMGAAALAGAGRLNPWMVFVAACVGNLTSDFLWYMVGYTGHLDFVRKRLPGFVRFDRHIQAVEKRLRRDGIKMLVISKLSFGIMAIPILIGTGISRVSYWRILGAGSVCQIFWGGSLVTAGYYLGGAVARHRLGFEAGIFLGGLFLFVIVMTLYRYIIAPER
jgi:membrane protein DedA with SNARE-associated domain